MKWGTFIYNNIYALWITLRDKDACDVVFANRHKEALKSHLLLRCNKNVNVSSYFFFSYFHLKYFEYEKQQFSPFLNPPFISLSKRTDRCEVTPPHRAFHTFRKMTLVMEHMMNTSSILPSSQHFRIFHGKVFILVCVCLENCPLGGYYLLRSVGMWVGSQSLVWDTPHAHPLVLYVCESATIVLCQSLKG